MPILHFKEIDMEYVSEAGGKGASLGEMTKANFPVPSGFVVSTKAFFEYLDKHGFRAKIAEKLEGLDVDHTQKLDEVSEDIRDMILSGNISVELRQKITKNLSEKKYAVRSSATAEDLPGASFAGQQDTYLEIEKEKVVEHVKKCWASLFTSRAIYYREKNNFPHTVGMAVVVQEMVDADFAGVMFTVDPIYKKFLLIECASGLGEKVVSGSVTPNNYFIEKVALDIKESMEPETFDHSIIKEIAKLGLRIEEHYKIPMDVEFAVKDNKVYLLQARPITTL